MNQKRKIISLCLTAVLALLLFSACGKTGTDTDEQAAQNIDIETQDTETASGPAQDPTGNSSSFIGSFVTEDLNGNEVTESIFAEKEYTMINVWGTYCGPCINEMPELEQIHQNMPDNMQIIGMVCDLPYEIQPAETLELANEIVETTGVTYPSLMVYQDAYWFLDTTNVVPTTYFVDSEGKLVSDIIYGADIDAYRAAIEKLGK